MDLVDLRVGEARIVRDVARSLFDLDTPRFELSDQDWGYNPAGLPALTSLLQDRYGAPIIVTNGATQALHAAMHALKHHGHRKLGVRVPYWNRIKDIAINAGLEFQPIDLDKHVSFDSLLLTAPNNPDGYMPSLDNIRAGICLLKQRKIPVIHDAAYYTRSYLPCDFPIEAIGDVQIFSASKMFGLSGLRLGWIAVHNASWLEPLLDYVALSTVGVSVAAQKLLVCILNREQKLPWLMDKFHKQSRDEIRKSRNIFKEIDPTKIELPADFDKSCGVFAWVRPKIPGLFASNNIAALDGAMFGKPGWTRINLAAGHDLVAEAVRRINVPRNPSR